jgi:ribonuclease P protein component
MIMGFGPVWRPKAAEKSWRVVALSAELSFVSQFQPRNRDLIRREGPTVSGTTPMTLSKSLNTKTLSMPRSLSLKNRESIRKLFRNAKRRSGSSLTVFYRISPLGNSDEDRPAKWLVAIPKRTGNAVRRNKIRRALRETIRLWDNRDRVAGEIAVRYNPPRLTPSKDSVKKASAKLSRSDLLGLRRELVGLLEDVYSRTKKRD